MILYDPSGLFPSHFWLWAALLEHYMIDGIP